MYNKGYDINGNGGYQPQPENTHDYYRSDVPTGDGMGGGSGAGYGGSGGGAGYGGNIEEMLFYPGADGGSRSSYDTGAESAGVATARQAQAQAAPRRSATMYAEPDTYTEPTPSYGAEEEFDEDAYPSVTTMQFRERETNPYEDYREENEPIFGKRYKISTKGKIIVAVYALAIITVLLLIILNTRLLKNMNAQISDRQAEIVRLQQENRALGERLEYVMSDEVVEQKAESVLGMVHD